MGAGQSIIDMAATRYSGPPMTLKWAQVSMYARDLLNRYIDFSGRSFLSIKPRISD